MEFPSFYAAGLLTLLFLLGVYHLQAWLSGVLLCLQRPAKTLAAGSFSLYLYHFPILVAIRSLVPYERTDTPAKIAIFITTVALCFALAHVTETRKHQWVTWLSALYSRLSKAFTPTSSHSQG